MIAVAEIFFLNIEFAKAISIPSATEIATELEQRYHVSSSSIQNMGESLNVSADKSTAPQVMIFFEPSEPREGKKLTARALPMYFQNPKEKLYYTWYIKHGPTDSDSNWNKNENLNGDGRKNVEDGKIEAMRIIATNGYNNQDEPKPNYGKDGDNDEYQACVGGDDKCGTGTGYCYIHDFQRGTNSEIVDSDGSSECEHLFPDTDGQGTAGDESFGSGEEKFWGTNPQDANTAGNGNLDEANVSGLGQDIFSWIYQEGDEVGVAVEGTSLIPTKYPGGSFMTMWALTNNTCKGSDPWTEQQAICPTVSGGDAEDTTLTPLCGKTVDNYSIDPSTGDASTDFTCNNTKTTPSCSGATAVCDNGQRAMCVPNSSSSFDNQTVLDYFKGSCLLDGNGLCIASGGACNNVFTADGKCEYLDTTSSGCSARAPVCVSVTHSNGATEPAPLLQTGSKVVTISGFSVTIPTTTVDINDCLKYNLVDPAEKKLEKLDVSLDYTPENPTNDASGSQMGDMLTVSSIINNPSQNSGELRYEWKVEAKRKGGGFVDISKSLVADKLVEKLEGLGLASLNISLNLGVKYKDYFSNDLGSFKITNTARESFLGKTRVGKGEIVASVNSTSKRINAYLTSSNDGATLIKGEMICGKDVSEKLEDKTAYYVCPVTRNQILKLEVDSSGMSDFAWTVDGEIVGCGDPVSGNCAGTNSIVMPIADSEGKTLSVKVKAKNIEEGKSVELSKTFQIVKPYIKISSKTPETFWPKVLGNYSDLNGVKYPDLSNSVFETAAKSEVTLDAEFHPLSLDTIVKNSGNAKIEWNIDGAETGSGKTLDFNTEKEAGDFYNIELNAFYEVSSGIRKLLRDKWNISPADSEGEILSASIQAEVTPEGVGGTVASKNAGRILASLISNLPSQITFLLRISLTIFIVILISGIASNSSYFLNQNKKRSIYE